MDKKTGKPPPAMRLRDPNVRRGHERIIFVLLIAVFLLMSLLSPRFFTFFNLSEATRNFMETGLIALPMTFVILTNAIDLSVGSTAALCAVCMGYFYYGVGNIGIAIVLALVLGALCGAVNGAFVGYANMPSFIVTLATMYIFRGIAMGISEASTLTGFPEVLGVLGQGTLLGLPVQLLLFAALAAVFGVVLRFTDYGRTLRTIGHNPMSAYYAGINVARTRFINYVLSGTVSALAGIIFTSRIAAAKANIGTGYELDAITAVVLGGTSISGGYGSIKGTVMGILLVGILKNGLTLARVSSEMTSIIIGTLLITTIILSRNAGRWVSFINRHKEVNK